MGNANRNPGERSHSVWKDRGKGDPMPYYYRDGEKMRIANWLIITDMHTSYADLP